MRRYVFFGVLSLAFFAYCSGGAGGGGEPEAVTTGDQGGSGDDPGGGGGSPTTVENPTFSPPGGVYGSAQNVTITSATPGATICYRTDGTDPTAPTPGTCGTGSTTYTGPVNVSSTTTIKALGTKAGMTNSSVVSATYTIDTTAPTPGSGITFTGTSDTQTTVNWGAATDSVTPASQLQYRLMRSMTNNMGT
ncbi:MAG: chitobiase/beta-hexosaminidase C-terminal domain-containing protein, partial [Leptospiraceae bacterium]|nr:chitobiase/beta-hexosaminidase C-terminal domain-containing protein [Leptospiraceae bacterium]